MTLGSPAPPTKPDPMSLKRKFPNPISNPDSADESEIMQTRKIRANASEKRKSQIEIQSISEDESQKVPKPLARAQYKAGGKFGIYSEEMIYGEDGDKL